MAPAVLLFDEVLAGVFSDEVRGVDCVIESKETGQAITFSVVDGVAHFV